MRVKDASLIDLYVESVGIRDNFGFKNPTKDYLKVSGVGHGVTVSEIGDTSNCGVCYTKGGYGFSLSLEGVVYWNGHEIDPAKSPLQMGIVYPDRLVDFCVQGSMRSFYVNIDKALFDQRCESMTGKTLGELTNKGFVFMKNIEARKRCVDLLYSVVSRSVAYDDLELSRAVVRGIIDSLSIEPQELPDVNYCNKIAVKVHSYLLSKKRTPLTLDEICEANRANKRSIQQGFKELYGMGPIDYHKVYRLNQVRKYLKQNGLDNIKLVDLIGMYGFYHSGRFSEYYKSTFGVLPSQETRELQNAISY